MARSGYRSNRALAKALGTDGSLIGKWLEGATPSARHRAKLPELLGTPADYFETASRADRLAVLEETAVTMEDLAPYLRVVELLARGRREEALRAWSETAEP